MGVFVQQSADLIPDKLSVRGGLRYGHFTFTSTEDPSLGVPGQEIPIGDTTFNAGAVYAVTPELTFTASVSRGFRAANAFDFGAIGLSGGAGFEISPQSAVELGGMRGSTDGATAISTGQVVGDLDPERLMAYEAGVRWQLGPRQHLGHRVRSRVPRRHRAPHADLPDEHRRTRSLRLHRDSPGRIRAARMSPAKRVRS